MNSLNDLQSHAFSIEAMIQQQQQRLAEHQLDHHERVRCSLQLADLYLSINELPSAVDYYRAVEEASNDSRLYDIDFIRVHDTLKMLLPIVRK